MAGTDALAPVDQSTGPILVIDDDSGTRLTIQWMLEEVGFVVETAMDGIQGLERAAHTRPALVILDLWLPGADGSSVAARLRTAACHDCGQTCWLDPVSFGALPDHVIKICTPCIQTTVGSWSS